MVTEKPKIEISKSRKWWRRILILLAVIILLPIGLFTIGWLNRDTVIDKLQDWYSENHTGTLTIEKVNANFISGFPKVGFRLKNIKQIGTDTIADVYSTLHIDEVKLTIGVGNLLRGNIEFEKISIKNAIITSEVISKRSFQYHEQLKRSKQTKQHSKFQLPEWLSQHGTTFFLYDIKYISKDSILNKYFNFDIHKVEGSYKGTDSKVSGLSYIDITVHNLGFNTKKGSFSNGARFKGNPKFIVNFDSDIIEIPEFPLKIDAQTFRLDATFNLSQSDSYRINFKNDQTDFKAVKRLLTDSISAKIKTYEIQNPFKSSVQIAGKFAYGNNPDVTATFSTKNNDLTILDKFHFKNTSFIGHLTTDIYETDALRTAKKSSKDIKIAFDDLEAQIGDIDLKAENAFYRSTPEANNFIEATIHLNGSNESLANLIETDNFDFKNGNFLLNATISGDIPNPYQFLNSATGEFYLDNTQVILKKNGLQLPIETIHLSLERETSILKQLVINLPSGDHLELKGQLKNISGLLSKTPTIPTTSHIYLDSEELNINEVIDMAKQFIPKSTADGNNRKTLHETLDAVYTQFHPTFGIDIKTLQYNEYIFTELKSTTQLLNSETVHFKNLEFTYDDALTSLNGNVVVHGVDSKFKDAIFMDVEATSKGSIAFFEELFNIELFRIDSGDFQFNGNIKGNIKEFDELLNTSRGDLELTNTKLYYQPADLEIVIDSLLLFVDNSDIRLKQFSLEVGEQYPLNLTGSVTQFPGFLLDDVKDTGTISLKISAPYLDADELQSTIKSFKKEDRITTGKKKKALHRIFEDVNRFNPQIELDIDSLKFNNLITKDIKAAIYFENDSILQLNHLDLNYKNTTVSIEGNINAHNSQLDVANGNPFDLDFFANVKGKSEDLNDYLKNTNFIFQSGDFEFKGNYKAQAEDLDVINSKTFGDLRLSNTLIDFKAANLQIPVDSLHVEINDDLATLKTLDIQLPGKSSVFFSGSIDNFSEFINNDNENSTHSSNFNIKSPYLDSYDIRRFFKNSTLNTKNTETKDLNLFDYNEALHRINNSFKPSVSIDIDTLHHEKMDLTKFGLDLYFDRNGNLKIEDTGFDFYGGSIAMNVEIGMNNPSGIPVTIGMDATEIDLFELVSRFDYFNDENLKNADKIEGIVNFNLDGIATLDADGKLIMDSLNGMFHLNISDVALYNYKPVMNNSVLMKDERFEHLQFRPIVQSFEIRNGVLIIPRTEIQSSAIHLFVEGKVKFEEYIDVWLSIPFKNLKSNDGLTLPEKTTYAKAGSKFFVQLLQNKNSQKEGKQKLNVKIKLSNRKLRKEKQSHGL